MEKLSDFKPLRRLALPELGDLQCSGLVVIVGPNSSGKSQFLQDIYKRLAGEPRELVVAKDIQIDKPPLEPFLKCLEAEGLFSTLSADGSRSRLLPKTMYLGMGQSLGQLEV